MTTSNPIIRIVDDEAVVRKALKFLLESEGWTVEAYEKGSEFLIEDRPSLIGCLILDVAMPEMNGLELYRRLRERNYEVPVIFLTGHGDVDMAVQAMKDGAIDFIQKPINEERLLSAVAKAVRYDESHRGWTISAEEEKKRYQTLTAREKQILSLIAKGLIKKLVSASGSRRERSRFTAKKVCINWVFRRSPNSSGYCLISKKTHFLDIYQGT